MLITPSVDYEDSYIRYIEELGDEERYPYPLDFDYSNFPLFVEKLNNYSNGIALPDKLVPNTTFWLIKNGEIVACSHLRHTLNDALREAGGHIGIGVRPSMRGKGFGKELLQLTIGKAADIGIESIHIHCYENNKVSKSMLESLGAKLVSSDKLENQRILRYVFKS